MTTEAAKTAKTALTLEAKYEEDAVLKKIADFLRGRNGMALREAIEKMPGDRHDSERRVMYFKGK